MNKFAIVPTVRKPDDEHYTALTVSKLVQAGAEVYMDSSFAGKDYAASAHFYDGEELYKLAELIIVLGGDGSILRAAKSAIKYSLPILGINLGRLGYMAELEKDELDMLERVCREDFTIQKRMTLTVEKKTNGKVKTLCESALNDVDIERGGYSRSIDMKLYADGRIVRSLRADGIIFATPTGSTAYSLAAGGSVLDPTLECICATPVCPISRYACPIVFSGNSTLELVNVDERAEMTIVNIDGIKSEPLHYGESLIIRRSPQYIKMAELKDEGFFSVLNSKISEYELKD